METQKNIVRLLLAEDSAVQRELLAFVLEEAGGFDIVGTASDGLEAVEKTCRLRPDIVLMDCHMPKANGIEATRLIMSRCPTPIVVVSATLQPEEMRLTFDAVKSGALAVMTKPAAISDPEHDRQAAELVQTLRLMSEVKVVGRRTFSKEAGAVKPSRVDTGSKPARVVAIAGSTGAPGVVADILKAAGPHVTAPVLIVQHIARGFVAGFAAWLGKRAGIPVVLPGDGTPALPGSLYVAPDDHHMTVDRGGLIRLVTSEPEEGFRPSANVLFRSVAKAYGPRSIGILLTGMGRDGAAGLLDIRRAGGMTAVQDEDSSIVFGMPREAIRLDAAMHVLPPGDLARLIVASTSASHAQERTPK